MSGINKRYRRYLAAFLIVTILAAVSAYAQSDESGFAIQNNLIIATTDNQILAVDRLVYVAFRNIRFNVDFVCPIVREGYTQANEGIVDGVIAAYPNLHTVYENLRQVPVPLENNNVLVFAPDGSDLQINSWDELDGLRVGILVNRTYILERLPENTLITEKETNRAVLNGIVSGEYDVAVLVERDHETLTDRHNVARVGQVDKLTEYLYLNARHEPLVPLLSAALSAMISDGSASQILNALPLPEINQKRTIVHIVSSSIETDREDRFNEALREAFEDDTSIEWMTVNLDAKRFARDQFNMAYIASLLRADCVSRNVSAVVVSGDIALDFLNDYYYLFFRNVPVLFYGVSENYSEIIQEHAHFFTGIVKSIEAYETVRAALDIFPGVNNIFVVNDNTVEGIQYRNAIESDLSRLEGRLNIEYNENTGFESLLARINALPEDSLVFIGSYFVDADHQFYSMSEMRRLLERNCDLPILSVYSTDLAYGAIGGRCLDYHRYGEEIAGMLNALLSGGKAEDVPIILDSTSLNRWVFDYDQMIRFSVRPGDLPDGANVINRAPSIMESNPQFFIALVVLAIISVLVIIGTGIFIIATQKHNRQRSRLQKELAVEKSMLETIFNSAPELIYVKDLDLNFIRVNKKFEEHFGCSEKEIIGERSYRLNMTADLVNTYEEADRTAIGENRLVMLEGRVPGVNGASPYFEVIKSPMFIGGEITGVICIAYDITHRKEMEEAAQAASRAKSNFLANMSHEMRTPLTAVLGLTELTLETAEIDEETHSNLVKVYRSGETLMYLVNDILDISKIEADRLELNPLEYDVPSLLNDAITQSVLYIGEKPVKLVLDIKEDLPNYLYGDELRIKQILNNLLSNAFKFTREGTVELSVWCDRDGDTIWMTIRVSDTGVGIRQEDIGKLFNLYTKMEEETSRGGGGRRIEGTGLGLSISKRVAEMMDGTITVESEHGKGSVFTAKLRQKYVSGATIGSGVVESLKKFHYSIKKFESAKMMRINLSYARVLVVDDNPTNLDVAKGLLSLYGMKVDCVAGGCLAIDAIRDGKVRYDAIFMDHMMPEMDGIEATRIIREEIDTQYAKTIPIIALTANAIVGNEEMFLSKGFQAFISKPIDLNRLDGVLRQWVRDKEAEAHLPDQIIRTDAGNENGTRKFYETIPGLDVNKGIARFGYSENTYLDVLRSYAVNTQPLLDAIKEVDLEKLDDYAVIVHGIKGSSRGIFAETAGDRAEDLENAAKTGDRDFVIASNNEFIETVSRLVADIESALVKYGEDSKPVKDTPDREHLTRLMRACESFDIDEIDAAMDDLESYEYNNDDGLVANLRKDVDQGKYRIIAETLLDVIKEP